MLRHISRDVLKLAWSGMVRGEYYDIYDALDEIGIRHPVASIEVACLKRYICNSLKPVLTLAQWQVINGFGVRSDEQLRQDQINWIKWMLEV